MIKWLVPRGDLSEDQLRAVKLPIDSNKIIIGAPGSGKTLILAHRASYLLNEKKVNKDKLAIFVFTNSLKEYIKSGIIELDVPESCVSTFDSWCWKFYKDKISKNHPKNKGYPDYDLIKEEILDYLISKNNKFIFDVVLVDEGQDLNTVSYKILKIISNHLTVCFDKKQKIYNVNTSPQEVSKILDVTNISVNILSAFRCSPFIVDLAAEFIEDENEKEIFKNQNKRKNITRETPLLYIAKDYIDERENLNKILRSRIHQDENIGILLFQSRSVFGLGKSLIEDGIDIEFSKKFNEDIDLSSNKPKVMTYHKAKGLTFDTILMPSLTRNSFSGRSDSEIVRLLFVGISRAVKWVYLSSTHNSSLPVLKRMMNLQKQNKLTLSEYDNLFNQNINKVELEYDREDEIDLL